MADAAFSSMQIENKKLPPLRHGDFVDLTDEVEEEDKSRQKVLKSSAIQYPPKPNKPTIVIHNQQILTPPKLTNVKPISDKKPVPSCGFIFPFERDSVTVDPNDKILKPSPASVRKKKFPTSKKDTGNICSDDDDVILVQSSISEKQLPKTEVAKTASKASRVIPNSTINANNCQTGKQQPQKQTAKPISQKKQDSQKNLQVAAPNKTVTNVPKLAPKPVKESPKKLVSVTQVDRSVINDPKFSIKEVKRTYKSKNVPPERQASQKPDNLQIPVGMNLSSNQMVVVNAPSEFSATPQNKIQRPQMTIQDVFTVTEELEQETKKDDIICLSDEETTPIATIKDVSSLVDVTKTTECVKDICETVSAVATITPDSNQGKQVFYILCPLNPETGLPSVKLNDGQIQQVLALVPQNSELANTPPAFLNQVSTPSTSERREEDVELQIPPLIIPKETGIVESSNNTPTNKKKPTILNKPLVKRIINRIVLKTPPQGSTPNTNNLSLEGQSSSDKITLNNLLESNQAPKNAGHSTPNRSLLKQKVKVCSTSQDDALFKRPIPLSPPKTKDPIGVENNYWHPPTLPLATPCEITPVDIATIMKKGKQPEIAGRCKCELSPMQTPLFRGFSRREATKNCYKEISKILTTEEKKMRQMKKNVKEKYDGEFVACGGNSELFLPEGEDSEDLPTIGEVISKVNEEVSRLKHKTIGESTKNQALQLIKKGLELMQSWTKLEESQTKERNYRKRQKRITPPPIRENNAVPVALIRKRTAAQTEPVVPAKSKKIHEDNLQSQMETVSITKQVVKRRRGRKPKNAAGFSNDDSELLVVKRVDIIKNYNTVPKRRRK